MSNGQQTKKASKIDYVEFDKRLLAETNLLCEWFIDQRFMECELELALKLNYSC